MRSGESVYGPNGCVWQNTHHCPWSKTFLLSLVILSLFYFPPSPPSSFVSFLVAALPPPLLPPSSPPFPSPLLFPSPHPPLPLPPFPFLSSPSPPDAVDVNVTPDKRQILIQQERVLLTVVKANLLKLFESMAGQYDLSQVPPLSQGGVPSGSGVAASTAPLVSSGATKT